VVTYKYKLYPNKEQQQKLWLHANKLNWLYNYFLDMKIKAYEKDKTNISKYDLQKQLPKLKIEDTLLKEIYSQVVQQVTYRLDKTYSNFFRRGYGFPKFRSCKKFFGITYPQLGYSIQSNKFITKIYGNIKFIKHRNIHGNIKTVTIKNESNKWFLCIVTDYEKEKTGNGVIGIDVGITNLAALSNGEIIKNKTHAKYFDKHINTLKSRRDKCKKGSNKVRYLNIVIQRLYGAKNRKINDFQHKVSKNLSSIYDTIFIEKLNLKQMSEGKITGLNRKLRNAKISSFIDKLKYKIKKVVQVNPAFTSQVCNNCGGIHEMPLSKRVYICECGYKEDRDVNAAKNILCLGQAILEGVCTIEETIQKAFSLGKSSPHKNKKRKNSS